MKKILLLLSMLFILTVGVKAQNKDTTFVSQMISDVSTYNSIFVAHSIDTEFDTIPVIAFCIDTATLETKFRKIYAIYGYRKGFINFNGLLVYQEYLDAEKKPITQYKVIYAIK